MTNYNWIDNPTESGVAICDPDILNECLMHLKYDNHKITQIPCCLNSGNINSNGNSDLIETQESSKIILNVPGNYTINIPQAGYYPVVLVGGGGKGQGPSINYMGLYSYCGGGSGAAFVGEIYLNSGSHNIKIGGGGGNSSVDSLIVAGGSTNAGMSNYNMQRAGGYGGVLTISSSAQIRNVTVQRNGNNGGFNNTGVGQSGGASVYQGYGNGANSSNQGRTNGFFSIIITSYTNNVVYKVGGSYKPVTGTLANGEQFTLNGINSDNVSSLSNGTYVKYIGADGSSELLNTPLIISKTQPAASNNKVWINNGKNPISIKKYVAPNYTNNGATITSKGIASGFGISKSIYIPYIYSDNVTEYKEIIKFTTGADITTRQPIRGIQNNENKGIGITINSGVVNYRIGTGSAWSQANSISISANATYFVEFTQTATKSTFKLYNSSKELLDTQEATYTPLLYSPIELGNNYIWGDSEYFYGTIDLSEYKIYIDNTVVYQPVIDNWQDYDKVPLGKITVASGAVTDVETLPYNVDYIRNNIVKSYKNGNVGYQIYADGYCIQWGRADSANGGTVTLPVSYEDSNYNIQLTSHRSDSSYDTTVYITGRLKGSFTWASTVNYTAGMNWITCGYIS